MSKNEWNEWNDPNPTPWEWVAFIIVMAALLATMFIR